MPIIFDCPQCGREIRVRSAAAGQMGHCTTCEAKIKVPDVSEFRSMIGGSASTAAGSTCDLPNGFLKDATPSDVEAWLNRPKQQAPTES